MKLHSKYLSLLFTLLVISNFLIFSNNVLAKNKSVIEALSRNAKILRPERLLKDFSEGKTTTRVIVNLARPLNSQFVPNLKNPRDRRTLRDTVASVQSKVINHMEPVHFRLTNKFKYVFGFSAEVSLEGLRRLSQMAEAASIQKDEIRYPQLAQGIPLMNASIVRNIYNGQGVSIAICDTGIDYKHERLGSGIFPNSKVIGGYDCGDDDNDPMDEMGHGTCCAGIAAGNPGTVGDYIGGVAYNAKLYVLKITKGSSGGAYDSDIIAAWDWCVDHWNDDPENPIKVISTSFGGGYYTESCDNEIPVIYPISYVQAAENATNAGITIFCPSGNEGYCEGIGSPACLSKVISVGEVYDASLLGQLVFCVDDKSCISYYDESCWACEDATTQADLVCCYSNSGNILDLLAPGHNCYTTDISGSGGYSMGNYYSNFGGTSAACPYAAGAAACLQSAAKQITGSFLTPEQVRTLLTQRGDLIIDSKNNIAKPRINLGKAIDFLKSCSYTLTPRSVSFPANGGQASINVSTQESCSWRASSNTPWIHITSGTVGNGPGQVTYSVDENPGPPRTGIITIAGETFTIKQKKNLYYYEEATVPHVFVGNGKAQGWNGDDECWEYSLPFSFPFFGQRYTSLWVSSNGFVDFSVCSRDYSNSDSEVIKNVRIAPLWTDMVCTNVYIHQPSEGSICIRWEGYEYGDHEPINIELVLYKDGKIRFNYGDGNTTIRRTGYPPTIGISAGDGIHYMFSSYDKRENLTNVDSLLYSWIRPRQVIPWLPLLLLGDE